MSVGLLYCFGLRGTRASLGTCGSVVLEAVATELILAAVSAMRKQYFFHWFLQTCHPVAGCHSLLLCRQGLLGPQRPGPTCQSFERDKALPCPTLWSIITTPDDQQWEYSFLARETLFPL